MKPKKYIEVRVNGVLDKDAPLRIDSRGNYKQYSDVLNRYKKLGYEEIESSNSGTAGYHILVNHIQEKCVYVSYVLHFGATDFKGNRIYYDSVLKKVPVLGELEPDYNKWFIVIDCFTEELYLRETIGISTIGELKCKDHTDISSSDVFKDFIVVA